MGEVATAEMVAFLKGIYICANMRQDNWQIEVNALASKMQVTEFKWHDWDCGYLAHLIIDAVTGKEDTFDKIFRGKYSTAIGSARILKKNGYKDLRSYLKSLLGDPISASHAWRGDIAFYEGCCGLCLGQHSLFIGSDEIIKHVNDGKPEEYRVEGQCCVKIPRNDISEYFRVR